MTYLTELKDLLESDYAERLLETLQQLGYVSEKELEIASKQILDEYAEDMSDYGESESEDNYNDKIRDRNSWGF